MRLREIQDSAFNVYTVITCKGPPEGDAVKVREEIEIHCDEGMDAVLAWMDYVPVISYEKTRSNWDFDGCVVSIDYVPELGSFLEIEGETKEDVESVIELLGIKEEPELKSFKEIVSKYCEEHSLTELKFRRRK